MLWGGKKNYVSPTLKWQEKTKQGSKSQWSSKCKESLSSPFLHHQRKDSRKKHRPQSKPWQGKRRKPDSLISSILSGNGQPNPDRDLSWWRCHLEASYRCVSHMEKELIKKTVSLGVILWKLGDVYKCKATWTPKNEHACWRITSVPSNSKKSKAESCRSTVRIPKGFTSANK